MPAHHRLKLEMERLEELRQCGARRTGRRLAVDRGPVLRVHPCHAALVVLEEQAALLQRVHVRLQRLQELAGQPGGSHENLPPCDATVVVRTHVLERVGHPGRSERLGSCERGHRHSLERLSAIPGGFQI
eukprot:scaffold50475_cov66-Phaeocystis_antarctica.AAC.4